MRKRFAPYYFVAAGEAVALAGDAAVSAAPVGAGDVAAAGDTAGAADGDGDACGEGAASAGAL